MLRAGRSVVVEENACVCECFAHWKIAIAAQPIPDRHTSVAIV